MKLLSFMWFMLNLCDGLLTAEGVSRGSSELNWIGSWLICQGWLWYWLVKIGLAVFVVVWIDRRLRQWPEIQRWLWIGLVILFSAVCVWNMVQVAKA